MSVPFVGPLVGGVFRLLLRAGRVVGRVVPGSRLGKAMRLIDRFGADESAREEMRREVLREYLSSRADFMRAGGFWLMLMFAMPLAFWYGAVVVYSVFWCATCAYPQTWSIAALPPPLDEWSGVMVTAIFAVVGLTNVGKR